MFGRAGAVHYFNTDFEYRTEGDTVFAFGGGVEHNHSSGLIIRSDVTHGGDTLAFSFSVGKRF